MSDTLVVYASYGSNLLEERFLRYIVGGTIKGNTINHSGSRDNTLPREKMALEIPGRVYMSGECAPWGGGGVAYFDPTLTDEVALMAGYLITAEQFFDVVAQENGMEIGSVFCDLTKVAETNECDLGITSDYSRMVHLGYIGHYPIFSFTSPRSKIEHSLNPASAAYLDVIRRGLRETFPQFTQREINDYLTKINGAPLPF